MSVANQIGVSLLIDRNNIINDVKGAIRAGFRFIEVVILEPKIVTYQQMQALKEISKANNVYISVHSPVDIVKLGGLSGNSFSELVRASDLRRAKQTIDLAATMGLGGPVTLHSDFFDRPLFDVGDGLFR